MFDDIIVGGGSSGAVLASRLSEDPTRKVLLLEAGPCYSGTGKTPTAILNHDVPVLRGYNWPVDGYISDSSLFETLGNATRSFSAAGSRFSMMKTAVKSTLGGNNVVGRFDCPVGRVIGGSSSVNGALALRAVPQDFDAWVSLGNDQWGWDSVLPFFKKVEHDLDHTNDFHGAEGAVQIRHEKPESFTKVQRAFYETCLAKGYPETNDFNAPDATGVGGFPKNIDEKGQRISSGLAYLTPEVQSRENLTIVEKARVNRIVINNGRAEKIEVLVAGRAVSYSAERIILSAGYIHSPAILMRSGIGAETDLKRLRIPVEQVLPGVGQNLVDHPVATIWAKPKPNICPIGETTHQASLRYSSQLAPNENDMSLFMLSAFDITTVSELKDLLNTDREAMALSVVLGTPISKGRINLVSTNPAKSPAVYSNLLKERLDMDRMIEGVQLAWSIINDDKMRDMAESIPVWHEQIMDSPKKIEQILKSFVRGSSHAGGTAKMGAENDPMAVVNQQGKVHGCENLFVADTSIMPETVRTSTNITAMMIGERISYYLN